MIIAARLFELLVKILSLVSSVYFYGLIIPQSHSHVNGKSQKIGDEISIGFVRFFLRCERGQNDSFLLGKNRVYAVFFDVFSRLFGESGALFR